MNLAADCLARNVEDTISITKGHIKALNRLGICTLRDLLFYAPKEYKAKKLDPDLLSLQLPADVIITQGKLKSGLKKIGKQFIAQLGTQGKTIDLVFFQKVSAFLNSRFQAGSPIAIEGCLCQYNGLLQIVHPELLLNRCHIFTVEPLYPLTYGLSNKGLIRYISKGIQQAKEAISCIPECNLLAQGLKLPAFFKAIEEIHRPSSESDAKAAFTRLALDELIAHRLCLVRDNKRLKTRSFTKDFNLQSRALENLKIKLSFQQEQAVKEIECDQAEKAQMLRLLQGDVGSGKTVVALLTALNVAAKGMQTAILAPTELLAYQHSKYFELALKGTKIRHCLLTGSLCAQAKKEALNRIASGDHMVIGTHALFQNEVRFKNLGYIIVDEQHRFGVKQRLSLINKADIPDVLLLSATPIPRSLSLTMLGNIKVSKLDCLPDRSQITTLVMPSSQKEAIYDFIERILIKGQKAYWICPTIETQDESSTGGLEAAFEQLNARFPNKAAALHGALDSKLREKAMEEFYCGKAKVLAATTIVETGIDVAEATVMVIEEAERFGLAQLHQLRGRIGRNNLPSYCILLYSSKGMSSTARRRLEFLRRCKDGSLIAQEDLSIRGRGDILGTKQSGKEEFYFACKLELEDSLYDALVSSSNEVQKGTEQYDFFTKLIHLKSNSDEFLMA